MKILAISAHYPPCHFGGYGIRVKNILDGLAERGHEISVLTNKPPLRGRKTNATDKYPIKRELHDRLKSRFFPYEVYVDLLDSRIVQQKLFQFKPDLIYLGHTYILSKAIMPFLARQSIPILYDEGGSGLIEAWTEHGRWFRFTGDYRSRFEFLNRIKPIIIKVVCRLSHRRIKPEWSWPDKMRVIFNSRLNQENAAARGVPVENSVVIHSGVDTRLFTFQPRKDVNSPLQIFVPGRIERRKGQLDAIELLQQLLASGIEARLTFAGAGWVDGYLEELTQKINNSGLSDKITLLPMLHSPDLVDKYHNSDICFFPSYFRTGFSRVPLEAMACGCVVISYGNEGSDEIVQDQTNGFIIKEGDTDSVFRTIIDLSNNPPKVRAITCSARRLLEQKQDMTSYVDQVETIIIEAASQ